ncbi:GNAT family N-acetyltransferase [Methylobacterium frigidaeris]|uniref:N-acetyltransferase domain-containing protein n=1 Tax=Methylobacterium frigidaeris TaxID=2038277 RepID=A0AA37HE27_9HYPH|nr:GNAT family N-acetyltransferase [Methylobacterium frigidaeris]GJD63816.1 hypothetical protein MPEAHAMD_3987 [Methylobacterium frigidaeris]
MALPFANGAFDPVVSYLTLIDVPDIRAAIPGMARVLRPGGTLLIANRTSFGTAGAWTDDGDAVTAVLAASYPVLMAASYEADTLTWALPLMVRANPALLASGRFHLAEVPDGIVGVGGWTPERPGTGEIEPGLGHVRHFAVHPAWIGRGVGRRVFAACRSQAQGGGVSAFECYASLNAEPFYRALGFREFGRREIPLGGGAVGFPAVLMRCRL